MAELQETLEATLVEATSDLRELRKTMETLQRIESTDFTKKGKAQIINQDSDLKSPSLSHDFDFPTLQDWRDYVLGSLPMYEDFARYVSQTVEHSSLDPLQSFKVRRKLAVLEHNIRLLKNYAMKY